MKLTQVKSIENPAEVNKLFILEEFSSIQPTAPPQTNPLKELGIAQKYIENFPEESKSELEESASIPDSENSFVDFDPVKECYVDPGPKIERFDF